VTPFHSFKQLDRCRYNFKYNPKIGAGNRMTYIVWIGGIDNHYKTKEEANEAVEDVILEEQ